VTTLAGLTDCIQREGLKSPALLVIGEVAAHAALDALPQDLRHAG
jgi:uroporphyrin-III C-methyltransferase